MFRNVESHFSQVPSVEMPRSTFTRPSTHTTTFNAGDLIPLYVDTDILPGDSVKMITSKVVRLQTLLTPIFGNVYLDTYWFFIPHRLVWNHWREFCKENTESAWIQPTEYQIPTIASPEGGFDFGTLADYFGWPCKVEWDNEAKRRPNVLAPRAYALVCNEFFRWTPVTDPLSIPVGDSNQTGSNGGNYITDVANAGKPFKVARYFDYFSSCLPSPQRGPTVGFSFSSPTLDVTPLAPVGVSNIAHSGYAVEPGEGKYIGLAINHTNDTTARKFQINSSPVYAPTSTTLSVDSTSKEISGFSSDDRRPINLYADIGNNISFSGGDVAFDINELRLAFQLQKFYERLALGGARYIEIIKSMFGVSSPDARLQRPEYLGGNRIPLNIQEVTNNAQSAQDFLGDLGAKSATSDIHYDFDHSFTEHGTLMCVACVRTDHLYEGLSAMYSRRKFTDVYWPVFSSLGNLPVYDSEIYADADTIDEDTVFGYQEAWASYRYRNNMVSAEMRPSHPQSLSSWNLADQYSEVPTLSDSWIREDKTNLDRTLAVTSAVSNQIFGDFYFEATYTRVMPMYSIPGLIDHH